jgi:glyoxylase-like metal-dependent hydrolase (beta-lactamase superfamily II)
VDITVSEGDVLNVAGLALNVIHTPGHSPGHVCFYLREEKALFTGDHVVGAGTTAIGPPKGDMALYIDSLRKLLKYDTELLCPGHGPVVRVPARKIQELIDHRLDREEQVLGLLRDGKETVEELVKEIYPELPERLINAAKGQAKAHLVKLENEGRVASRTEGEEEHYSPL